MHSVDRPICELASSIEMIGNATRSIYGSVDCEDSLRRALRELLAKVEVAS